MTKSYKVIYTWVYLYIYLGTFYEKSIKMKVFLGESKCKLTLK